MKKPLKTTFLALALSGAAGVVAMPAVADHVAVAIGPGGGIAFGYSDGYWDRAHAWHAWRNAEEAAAWRAQHREHFYEWRHDRDASLGWHEEHWWEARPVVTEHVTIGPAGGIAFGYNDGYWDRAHVWHAWRNAEEAAAWRAEHREHYYEWRHDRDGDGWRAEPWWDRR